jgi:oligoendopeptidase F
MEYLVERVHPSFGHIFRTMRNEGGFDIFPRAGKGPGAFSLTFPHSKKPFLYANLGATWRDAMTFLHEFGHCLHGIASAQIDNILLRHPGYEFCETASMGFELLSSFHLDVLWPEGLCAEKAMHTQIFHMIQSFPFMAMMDEWQHIIYSAPHFMEAPERNAIWAELCRSYRPYVDWNTSPACATLGWMSRSHVFTHPFYYIDYGIAQLNAIRLWSLYKTNPKKAVENYIYALGLGGQTSLQELTAALGFSWDLGEDALREIIRIGESLGI